MNIETKKSIIFSSLFIVLATAALSVFASIPYIYTVCGFSVLATLGHLVTLDDDMPGEWSNMEGSNDIWRNSRIQLGIKFFNNGCSNYCNNDLPRITKLWGHNQK